MADRISDEQVRAAFLEKRLDNQWLNTRLSLRVLN